MKYHEDYDVEDQYYTQVSKKLKLWSNSKNLASQEVSLMKVIGFRLFVSADKFDDYWQKIQIEGEVLVKLQFEIIDDYFWLENSEKEKSDETDVMKLQKLPKTSYSWTNCKVCSPSVRLSNNTDDEDFFFPKRSQCNICDFEMSILSDEDY